MVLKRDTDLRCPVLSSLDAGVVATQLVDDLWYPGGGHAVHLERGHEAVGHLGQGPDRATVTSLATPPDMEARVS